MNRDTKDCKFHGNHSELSNFLSNNGRTILLTFFEYLYLLKFLPVHLIILLKFVKVKGPDHLGPKMGPPTKKNNIKVV